jgi:hypothetical protein
MPVLHLYPVTCTNPRDETRQAAKPYDIYEFTDSRQAEVLARCCRVWVDKETLDPDAIILAEAVLKVGRGDGGSADQQGTACH